MSISFSIDATNITARACTIGTAHGIIETPVFMPVGTLGSVKGLTSHMLYEINAQIILGNTYHLMIRPGYDLIRDFGGLHSFINWQKPILTDSGGFQVMSLSGLRKINEDGVIFTSHLNGDKYFLNAEKSMEVQNALNADITMAFDECISYPATHRAAQSAMERSMRWAMRSKESYVQREGYGLFGIVQGGVYEDLRKRSIKVLSNIGFDGYAIGGLAVGEGQDMMFNVLNYLMPEMPLNKPRYLMGIGKPSDIIGAVLRGVDMFDCVLPTRNARNGLVYTRSGEIKIRQERYRKSDEPLDLECICYTCQHHSRGYISHLHRSGELLACTLMTIHNLAFYHDMMRAMRKLIITDKLHNVASDLNNLSWIVDYI